MDIGDQGPSGALRADILTCQGEDISLLMSEDNEVAVNDSA